jgi:hypothetical protein
VLGNPDTLLELGLDAASFVPLAEGARRTVAFFAGYLAERAA